MRLSDHGETMSAVSGIRRILADIASATGPNSMGWLNLGAGNPAQIPGVLRMWMDLTHNAVDSDFATLSAAYGPSRGTDTLVEAITEYFASRYGWPISPENVLVGPGAQLLAFAATTVFTGRTGGEQRSLVLPSMPDYTGYHGLRLEAEGVVGIPPRIVALSNNRFRYEVDVAAVRKQRSMGAMLLSNPRNPTGGSLTQYELDALIAVAEEREVPLIVDNAYGAPFPGVAGTDVVPAWNSQVVNCFTFSKAGIPGERVGFVIGSAEIIAPMSSFVSNTVLHASQLIQSTTATALRDRHLDRVVDLELRPHYLHKRAFAEQILRDVLGDEFTWYLHVSDGGMFCWLWIDEQWFRCSALYDILKLLKVCIVPGDSFFIMDAVTPELGRHAEQCVRLSLSADTHTISAGVSRIGEALRRMRSDFERPA
ncbi:aminotransferase class I/II-fold pyridoxal phosphate-dependent enzyme [Rhodococcus sp. NPDC058521]|uniref:aminotransferase class I/II-fold pyridoxal phosphate-dependent enzyme n=1 Tax=Rhodococcus sp. NPDC058521 TaxID=3346536 RepID=UPI0036614FA0